MSASCCHKTPEPAGQGAHKVLWIALAINAAMFAVEITAGLIGGSVALQADAVDFFGDAVNYGLSLAVLGMAAIWRTRLAALKGVVMGLFGLWVMGTIVYNWVAGTVPSAPVMGGIGLMALIANVICAIMLFRFRGADANMKSVWVCSRNDALSNIAVMVAASGVWASGSALPDLIVAALIGGLAIFGSLEVLGAVRHERRTAGRETADAYAGD